MAVKRRNFRRHNFRATDDVGVFSDGNSGKARTRSTRAAQQARKFNRLGDTAGMGKGDHATTVPRATVMSHEAHDMLAQAAPSRGTPPAGNKGGIRPLLGPTHTVPNQANAASSPQPRHGQVRRQLHAPCREAGRHGDLGRVGGGARLRGHFQGQRGEIGRVSVHDRRGAQALAHAQGVTGGDPRQHRR